MLGPTMCRYGSCATSPARIESSVLTASTCRCCSATRQSAHVTTSMTIGDGSISWIRCSGVVPLNAQTRLPERSVAWAIGESRGARIRWLATRYTVEKLTSFLRSHVMLIVLTTMSTWLFCSAVTRSADDRMRYSTCDGVPKMSRATSPAMSTSKPVISPVSGSPAGARPADAEQLAADVEADDQPAAGLDLGDGVVGLIAVGERPQAGGQV